MIQWCQTLQLNAELVTVAVLLVRKVGLREVNTVVCGCRQGPGLVRVSQPQHCQRFGGACSAPGTASSTILGRSLLNAGNTLSVGTANKVSKNSQISQGGGKAAKTTELCLAENIWSS